MQRVQNYVPLPEVLFILTEIMSASDFLAISIASRCVRLASSFLMLLSAEEVSNSALSAISLKYKSSYQCFVLHLPSLSPRFFKKAKGILLSPLSVRLSVHLSVMLTPPKPLDEIQPNLVCELLT